MDFCFTTICESLWLLECGAVKQWEMTYFAHTVCLQTWPFRTGNQAGACVLSFDLAKEARQLATFGWCPFAKTTANCSNSFSHFHLISSMSRPQRPLIMLSVQFTNVPFPKLPNPLLLCDNCFGEQNLSG
jgi:hypothetical protein